MNSDDVLRDYLEDGSPNGGSRMPDGAVRVRALLGNQAVWDEPPAGVLEGVLARIDTERRAGSGRGGAIAAGPRHVRPTVEMPPASPPQQPPGRDDHNVRSLSEHRTARRRLLAVAAAAVLFTGGGVGGWFAANEMSQPTEKPATVIALKGARWRHRPRPPPAYARPGAAWRSRWIRPVCPRPSPARSTRHG